MTTDLHPFANPGRTKLALVSRGVALPEPLPSPSRYISQANAAESVIDIRLPSGHFCTVPVGQPYTEASGFSLHGDEERGFFLHCGGETAPIELVAVPHFYRQTTRSGARMGSIASLHDRLLILHPLLGCGFFARTGQACGYCQYDSMLNDETPPLRDPLELIEVVRAALRERDVDTVYLYNGFAPGEDAGLRRLVPVVALLRKHLGHRQIALETVAPRELTVIDELYTAGLDIFICNLEVHDPKRFAEVCPGKAAIGGQEAVWRALTHAATRFAPGAVVSHLIVGLEPPASTVDGMKQLIDRCVVPLLHPFRPLPGTPLADTPIPSLDDVEALLLEQYHLLAASGLPTNRLRDMGRVLTPMEARTLVGRPAQLEERLALSGIGRRLSGWRDLLWRTLWNSARQAAMRYGDDRQVSLRRLLLRKGGSYLALLACTLLFLTALQHPPPPGLDPPGWRALSVFGLCLLLWVTQLLPLTITSLLGLALLPLAGVLPPQEVYSLFGNPSIFFILGAFILAAGTVCTGLSEHLALQFLDRVGLGPRRLLLAMLLLPAVMACVMPEHVVVVVLLPIAREVVRGLGLRGGDRYAQSLFLALAWGAIIGGVATLLGGARGPLALGLLQETTGRSFSFLDWSLASLPIVLPLLALAAGLLLLVTPFDGLDVAAARGRIDDRRLEAGALGAAGWAMGVLLAATVVAWMALGHEAGLAAIALIAVALMFALQLVHWKEIEPLVHWDVLLMYGGAIALGKALVVTGGGAWLAHQLIPQGVSSLQLLLALGAATLLLTECVSNAAAVAILLPVALPLALEQGIDPVRTALAIGIVAGFAFILPMGTPPNAMIYGTGMVRAPAMMRYGALLSLAALLFFAIALRLFWS
ncbi:MAG: DASS family sodium-coupled anion symporter [Zetaproteobacteria bacterium]|nr:MAG: DASS family sodium-coupled anion symporter [Zetaproteobacteria bacterium]